MKIALIGPAFPYRGGIAHHTNMLSQYLRRHGHTVDVISFARQYPKLLYPGRHQDELGDGGGFAGTVTSERLIDSINPFNWIRVGRLLRRRGYDVHVFRFWLPFFGPAFGTIARLAHRKGRKDVAILLDNFIPHESNPANVLLTNYLFRYCNFAIAQSTTVQNQLTTQFPAIPSVMLPHPMYENFGARLPQAATRARLGITASKVLLFFGFVRAYKGLDRLLDAMPEIVRRMPDVHLLVVGEFFDDPAPYMEQIRRGGVEAHVTVVNRYVANDEVADWFSASDAVVLPYHSATNSGIAQIAYNFATPVVVTDVGSLGEVILDGRTGFVLKQATPVAIADAVQKLYEGDTLQRFAANIEIERVKYGWDAFVEGMGTFIMRMQEHGAPR
ncbi:MAG: glycosyltransferase [Bacteroidetes bacterium]|nr:glycosyltransferase [Bacteroidota bacterium]